MKSNVNKILLTLLCIGVLACEKTGPGGSVSTVYVDSISGNDLTGDTKSSKPFKTLTKGLAVAQTGDTINVKPGTYDALNGEIFPLLVKNGIRLEGQTENHGNGPAPAVISGSGLYTSPSLGQSYSAALVIGQSTSVRGFKINAENGIAVWIEDGVNSTVSENTLSESDYGIIVAGSGSPSILTNDIARNVISGIEILAGSPEISKNNIANNSTGIVARNNSSPDLGEMTKFGQNNIVNNAICGFNNASSENVHAIGNSWNNDQFLFSASNNCSNGVDIANTYLGTTMYQYIPVNENPIFPGSDPIKISSPQRGLVLFTTTPTFLWEPAGSGLVMIGLFKKPVNLENNSLNTENLIWIWYPGLKNKGSVGNVNFNDGVNVLNGDLSTAVQPVPLDQGRTYYWAVWSWNAEGLLISRSSMEMYFTIANF
jgi:parallel beta-helix repeat protein